LAGALGGDVLSVAGAIDVDAVEHGYDDDPSTRATTRSLQGADPAGAFVYFDTASGATDVAFGLRDLDRMIEMRGHEQRDSDRECGEGNGRVSA
jgi:hypothetical protein